ncbi:hypothetical protein [Rhizobium sp. ZPR3]|uniref:Guanylate cyclase domain-containing protein n=2 Tax=unclassified Rhizobium TaxID=2613769 RepID=A0AAU7SR48_9HYPH
MFRSVSSAYPSAETATIVDWRRFLQLEASSKLVRQLYLRDPIKDVSFGFNAVAVFGFHKTPKGSKCLYFWHKDFKAISHRNGNDFGKLRDYLEFGLSLAGAAEKDPSWATVTQLHGKDWSQTLRSDDDDVRLVFELHWKTFGELSFVCLYTHPREDKRGVRVSPVTDVARNDCLSFHYDYFHYRSPIWTAVPITYIFDRIGSSIGSLCAMHLEPKSFWPLEKQDLFLWPWQRCIRFSNQELSFSELRTCSLVFDLRKSTLAMQSVRDIGKYSPFIESIVDNARDAIFANGGFFDKETGDGVVGHFVDFGPLDVEPAEKRAFDAAVQMVRGASEICEAFQSELDDWINNLGGAVGLHSGSAVWTAARNNVQAIGESVVTAARLCAEADVRSVFVSNGFFQHLSKQIRPEIVAKFARKSYLGKENGAKPQKSGFALDVSEMIK